MATKSALELLDNLIAEIEGSLATAAPAPVVVETTPSATAAVPAPAANNKKEKESKKEKDNNSSKENKKSKAEASPAAAEAPLTINGLDLRVGVIRSVRKHETAEKLYCEEIDVGEDAPRAIASGLVPYYSLEEMQGRRLVVVCNLKPRNLVGFKSHGMVLCASTTLPDGTHKVEFVDPPAGAQPGDRLTGEGLPAGEPLTASKCDKLKAFELLAADLKVNSEGVAVWKDVRLVTPAGEVCVAPTLRDCHVH